MLNKKQIQEKEHNTKIASAEVLTRMLSKDEKKMIKNGVNAK